MPILWNPKDPQYHNRNKREDAWRSISADLKVPASELKAKMRSLMGTFRSERSREKKSRILGSGQDEVYESKWFAYKNFDFLTDKNETIKPLKSPPPDTALEDPIAYSPLSSSTEEDLFPTPVLSNFNRKRSSQKRKLQEDDHEMNTLNAALEVLKSATDQPLDPFYLYGLNLANELRKYDSSTLAHVKKAISDIFFEADMGSIFLRHSDKHNQSGHSSHFMGTSNPSENCVAYLGPSSAAQYPDQGVRTTPSPIPSSVKSPD
ncbi:Alcohol dehydrogenase transcription factor Myb/SANT-like [Nesidiocoris tenuis]|uniref:Alcohol dehydrogenase transcription factor Myb/SANT-like n=1 Tax=Nesidiocoris tenuis TaxID=355587 RepID=A0ABN7AKE5_9HEMI|nr:Alcohol dehydrogenase transcription factor Myb/SANT-like [Nesidiocoris tenuis]